MNANFTYTKMAAAERLLIMSANRNKNKETAGQPQKIKNGEKNGWQRLLEHVRRSPLVPFRRDRLLPRWKRKENKMADALARSLQRKRSSHLCLFQIFPLYSASAGDAGRLSPSPTVGVGAVAVLLGGACFSPLPPFRLLERYILLLLPHWYNIFLNSNSGTSEQ